MPPMKQGEVLTILTHTDPETLKAFADALLPELGQIAVIKNRTGLVMLPYTDTAQGSAFHLGEVLVSEAQVQLDDGTQGYGLCVGRDLVQALGVAVLDAALTAGRQAERIRAFVNEQAALQREQDAALLRRVEATRVEMETF